MANSQTFGILPFAEWEEMAEYALEREKEKIATPIWLGNLFLSRLGITEERSYKQIFDTLGGTPEGKQPEKSEEEILRELLPLAEMDLEKGEGHGK